MLKSGTIEGDEADILGLMIDEYEKKHYPIEAPENPIEAIKIRMEELNLKQVDLADTIGGKNRVSEIMNRKRKLTVEMIRNLTGRLNLSPGLLIHDYKLTGQKRALTSRKVARHAMTNKKSLNITRTA